MSTYKAPLADMRFALFDVIGAEDAYQKLGFTDATRDVLDAVLEEGARFTETVLAPLNEMATASAARTTSPPARSPLRRASSRPMRSTSKAVGPG